MTSDFRELLEALNAYDVQFLIVGGHAVMKYTEPRLTKDLDLWIGTDSENAARVIEALRDFSVPLGECKAEDFTQEDVWFQIGVAPVRVDLLTSAKEAAGRPQDRRDLKRLRKPPKKLPEP